MATRIKYTLVWAAISLSVGGLVAALSDLGFWMATAIARLTLTANGVVAHLEDRVNFND